MINGSLFSNPQNELQEFSHYVYLFREMTLSNGNNQNVIDYFINHFPMLFKYAYRIGVNDKDMSNFCKGILFVQRLSIREQFRQRTNFYDRIFDFVINLRKYDSISVSSVFDDLPRIILSEDHSFIIPQFCNQLFFAKIIQNIDIYPAYRFIKHLPSLIGDSIHQALNQGLLEMIVKIMQDSPFKMKRAQRIFMKYIKLYIIRDIPGTLLKNRFTEVIELSIEEKRHQTIKFLLNLMLIPPSEFPSEYWDNFPQLYIPFYERYCQSILDSPRFDMWCDSCLNLILCLSLKVDSRESILKIFKKYTGMFFSSNTNSFLHNAYMKLFFYLKKYNFVTFELLQETELPQKLLQFFSESNPTEFQIKMRHCQLIYEQINPIVLESLISSSDIDREKWLSIKKKINEDSEIISRDYGNSPLLSTQQPVSWQRILIMALLIFLVFYGVKSR
ncbi:hypothetical protein TRFO_01221 [Tritrichomonas foetus]|uniref:Uncharacterized protein n=1 Tax=Tritrichomonas foetus TaxID=1144522 RepID=A0A1J4KCE0_9EUKA|nr:hypothetical protein TRFO_01221 [Tritrichomonas foetus]|eukprot:OHT07125.1 hypothetical protein TRFO_01221 [Tritrichomonas foetus]